MATNTHRKEGGAAQMERAIALAEFQREKSRSVSSLSSFVERVVAAGIIDPEEAELLDSTAIWGREAVEGTYNLLGSGIRKLLGVTARRRGVAPEAVAAEVGLRLTTPAETSARTRNRCGAA